MAILDTADIRAQMLAGRDADKWQMKCMSFLSDTMNVLKTVAELKYMGNDDAEGHRLVVMQTLAILIRDIMECSFLLDLFSRKPEHLQPWVDRGTDAGKKDYSPTRFEYFLRKWTTQRLL